MARQAQGQLGLLPASEVPREGNTSQQQGVKEVVTPQGARPHGVDRQPQVSGSNTHQ